MEKQIQQATTEVRCPMHSSALWSEMSTHKDDAICARFADKHGLSLEKAQVVFEETKRFLYVAIVSQQPCSPSKIVDEMWHEMIMHTAKYRDFCADFNGDFIDHTPSDTPELEGYIRTKKSAESMFGPLDDHCWPEPSAKVAGKCTCSNSGCSCNCSGNVNAVCMKGLKAKSRH